tara:strand:- start:1626 stop:3896 length:2271 start_codon:yes stop_codon:yes gene_type:complete
LSDGNTTNPIDAAAEITDAMMSSLADVVKNAISSPEEDNSNIEQKPDDEETVDVESNEVDDQNDGEEVPDTTVDDLVAEGEAAHRSGDHKAALKSFNKAIALDPSNAMAWFNRGVLLEAEQDSRGAKQAFVICLDLDPNHGPALANLAVLLDRLGETDGALEIADRALKYFPGHPHLVKIVDTNKAAGGVIHSTPRVMPHTQEQLVNQTLTHAVDTSIEEPVEQDEIHVEVEETLESEPAPHIDSSNEDAFEEILEDETEPEPVHETINIDELCAHATSLLSQGDAKGALQTLKEHLHGIGAEHFDSWKIAAGSMAAMGLDDHAISAYTHALGLDSTNAKCYFNLGALHERKGNVEAAIKCFSNALNHDNSYLKSAIRLANLAEATGDIANLLAAKRSMVGENGGRIELATLLIELAEGESRVLENTSGLPPTVPEGPALAREAISLCDENTSLMARACSASGDHTSAVKCWKAMIQSDKTNPELWKGLARALEAAGDMATAQRCHQKSQALSNPQPVTEDPLDAFADQQVLPANTQENTVETTHVSHQQTTPELSVLQRPTTETVVETTSLPLPELSARPEPVAVVKEPSPEVDLAAAALDAAARVSVTTGMDSNSNAIANQDIEWYNKGVGLIEDKKYREALSCFDRALPSFADNDEMVIRILNGRGNALYYLEDYPKCVESYHKAMVINPKGVQGKTLYNMGTAYAEMQRFSDAIKCFEQAMPRGLDKDQQKLAKEQIRRCNILQKEQQRKMG